MRVTPLTRSARRRRPSASFTWRSASPARPRRVWRARRRCGPWRADTRLHGSAGPARAARPHRAALQGLVRRRAVARARDRHGGLVGGIHPGVSEPVRCRRHAGPAGARLSLLPAHFHGSRLEDPHAGDRR